MIVALADLRDTRFHVSSVQTMNHRFKIGDHVRVTGILGELYPAKTATVVAVEPNAKGISELDLYIIEFPGLTMGDTKLADFQLAHSNEGTTQ